MTLGVRQLVSSALATLLLAACTGTGINNQSASLQGKRLELLKQAVPSLSAVGVLHGVSSTGIVAFEGTQAAAPGLGLRVVAMPMAGVAPMSDFEAAFRAATAAR